MASFNGDRFKDLVLDIIVELGRRYPAALEAVAPELLAAGRAAAAAASAAATTTSTVVAAATVNAKLSNTAASKVPAKAPASASTSPPAGAALTVGGNSIKPLGMGERRWERAGGQGGE